MMRTEGIKRAKRRAFCVIAALAAACTVFGAAVLSVAAGEGISWDLISHLAEVSGMDAASVEQILAGSGMSEEELMQMSEEQILEGLQIKSQQSSIRDYSYLFTDASVRQTLDDHRLLRVAVYSSDDAISPSLMIDYEEGKIYYSGGIRIFSNLDLADQVTSLDDETAAEVKALVREILEKGYDGQPITLLDLGDTLAGLAIETDLGVTNFTIRNVQDDVSLEQSNYVSQIFRIYYDSTGQGW